MVSLRAWNSSSVVLLFLSVNLLAAWINHIDDTDETYGYWEPLHYLVHSKGMQTWEYSPHYALRTYCFIVPLLPIAKLLAAVSVPKIYQFYILRATIGLFYAVAEANLTVALKRLAGVEVSVVFAFLLLLSPGVFFSSTSYLPSAVAGSLLMFSYSSWLLDKFLLAIVFGSAAVLLTGWPFVGVLFLPIGIHMLAAVFMKEYSEAKKDRSPSIVRAVASVGLFCLHGLLIALLTMVLGTLVDYVLYRKWTSPTINIFLYNAFSSANGGDNLYGIEPVSYYVKNLWLNLGISWPISLVSPLLVASHQLLRVQTMHHISHYSKLWIVLVAAFSWIALLFSRPHKEERFMYPVYPLLCAIASLSAVFFIDLLDLLIKKLTRTKNINSKLWILATMIFVSLLLFIGRIAASYRNYHGYFDLWKSASNFIATNSESESDISVCTGFEWYLFPNHFFLPRNAKLQFIADKFGGVLPQHFASIGGTYSEPLQPFNDLNREETSRYVDLSLCDYLVLSLDENKNYGDDDTMRRYLSRIAHCSSGANIDSCDANEEYNGSSFSVVHNTNVLSAEFSSPLARAYWIPAKSIQSKKYYLFRNNN